MKKYTTLLLFALAFSSCNYLDIVPDERTSHENAYETPNSIKGYLYSCYGYQPLNRDILTNAYHMMGGETTYFRKETFSTFAENAWSPANPQMTTETWGPIWDGIRKCYLFLSIIDKTTNLITAEEIKNYKAEANFMIAYYHFLSLRSYGPTIIIDKLLSENTPPSESPERSSVDEVVDFIEKKLEEALPGLAEDWQGNDLGRATRYAAIALRSRLYLYAASPIFNGQNAAHADMYADFKSPIDGRPLISKERSVAKWEKSAAVTLAAITELERAGFRLYGDAEAGTPSADKPSVSDPAQRRVRYCNVDYPNNLCEIIWSDTREETSYGVQRRSMIKQTSGSHKYDIQGCIVPTLQSVEYFYTKNGLPMDVDKDFDYDGRYEVVTIPQNYDGNNYKPVSQQKDIVSTTCKMHLGREPRFYASVGFHGGYIEIAKYNGANLSSDNAANKVWQLQIRRDDATGKGDKADAYSVTGYNNKKFCHPNYSDGWVKYPLPLFRMAELYLSYAEALVEIGGNDNLAKAKEYLDKVRVRAGLPTVDDAWDDHSTQSGYQNTQTGLREIVHRERSLELYLEGHKFFDVRRWMVAENFYGILEKGMNVDGSTDDDFFRPVTLNFLPRTFHKGQYLMPIPAAEINKTPQVIQNPYYN